MSDQAESPTSNVEYLQRKPQARRRDLEAVGGGPPNSGVACTIALSTRAASARERMPREPRAKSGDLRSSSASELPCAGRSSPRFQRPARLSAQLCFGAQAANAACAGAKLLCSS